MARIQSPALLLSCAFALSLGAAHAATLTVTTADDNTTPPSGSLREALIAANLDAAADTIKFAIPGAGPHTITLAATLPDITAPVTIDGYTQSGSSANTATAGTTAQWTIRINGGGSDSLHLAGGSDGSTIRGLEVFNGGTCIQVSAGSGQRIVGNFIRNTEDGIRIQSTASKVAIGGTSLADRNLVNACQNGIILDGADGCIVQGNLIGLVASGDSDAANGVGLAMVNATNALIGGTAKNAGNVISGNTNEGIHDSATSTFNGFNRIEGNRIGTNASGTAAVPNATGIRILDIGLETVGGDSAAARNVISGNTGKGLFLDGATEPTTTCTIQNNFIGTDITGTADLGNGLAGVHITGTQTDDTTIKDNLVSGNDDGLVVDGSANSTLVIGNLFGTDATGLHAIPNAGAGILLGNDTNTVIGGDDDDQRNVISGNDADGIALAIGSNTEIYGNFIGVDATGTTALKNGANGIIVTGARSGTIGDAGDSGNVISGNMLNGIRINGAGSVDMVIRGNRIGSGPQGVLDLGNGESGIHVNNTLPATLEIGGTSPGEGNIIAFNQANGITATGTTAGVEWYGNLIYGNGDIGIDLGDDGATANDGALDNDTGANNLQNFPTVESVVAGAPAVAEVSLATTASSTFTAEFYALTEDNRMRFLGREGGLATDGSGVMTTQSFVLGPLSLNESVVAVLIDDTTKDCSEFSAPVDPTDSRIDSNALYVKKAKFAIDFAKHAKGLDGDSLSFSGSINPSGIEDFFSSASIDISVNGQTLVSDALDPSGKNSGTVDGGSYKFSIKPGTGAYSFSAKGLDLRNALNAANEDNGGTAEVELGLRFIGTTLDTPDVSNVLRFDLKSALNKKASGKFAFAKNVTVTGAFLSLKTGATEKDPAPLHAVTAKGILTAGDLDLTPGALSNIDIDFGSAPITLTPADYTVKNDGPFSTVTMNKDAAPLLAKFQINNAKKAWSLTANPLDALLDAAGAGATSDSLDITIQWVIGTGDTVIFHETIELKRKDIFSGKWKR